MTRDSIHTPDAPAPIGPYSQAIRAGGLVFTAGQIGLDADGVMPADVAAQTRQVIANLAAVLAAAGCSLDDVVKTTIFLKDLNDFQAVNDVYAEHLGAASPARSTVEVARLPKDALVEIEAVAVGRTVGSREVGKPGSRE